MTFFQKICIGFLSLLLLAAGLPLAASAASGVPDIISYQGRLTNSSGQLLGGSGTTYYFRFSIWDSPTVATGTRLWPSSNPGSSPLTVSDGVFNVNIGDTANGYPDALTYNFQDNNAVYLQIEVSADNQTFETLGPRQRITSSGSAINAQTLAGLIPGTGANELLQLGSAGEINILGAINGITVASGVVESGTWDGSAISAQYGGTGISSYNTGDLVYASGTTSLAQLPIGAAGKILSSNGTTPVWEDPTQMAFNPITFTAGTSGTDFNVTGSPVGSGGTVVINLPSASATDRGLLTSADWTTFNNKQNALPVGTSSQYLRGDLTLATFPTDLSDFNNDAHYVTLSSFSGTAPLSYDPSTGTISISQANTNTNGYLSASDWNTFNTKQAAGNYITGLTGDGTASGAGVDTFTLANVNSAIGNFGDGTDVPIVTVNSKGLVTNVSTTPISFPVTSVNGAVGAVALTTTNVPEGTNLYYSDARARAAFSSAAPLTYNSTTGVISLPQATTSANGYLSSTDWNTFNGKQSALPVGTSAQYLRGDMTLATFPTAVSAFSNDAHYITLASISGSAPLSYDSGTGIFSIAKAGTSGDGYLSASDWNTFNGKQAAGNYITGLTGDGTASGAGSDTFTLATVNSNTGSFGDATHVAAVTVNGKGLVTSASAVPINFPITSVNGGTGAVTLAVSNTGSTLAWVGTQLNIPTATTTTTGLLSSADWNTFNGKQAALSGTGIVVSAGGTISYINGTSSQFVKGDGSLDNNTYLTASTGVASFNGRTGTVTPQSGDYTSDQVTQGSTNLYFSNALAIASTLTGYASGAGTVSSSDSILSAIQKLNGNQGLYLPLAGGTMTGQINWASGQGAMTDILGAADQPLTLASLSPVGSTTSLAGNAINFTASNAFTGASGGAAGGAINFTTGTGSNISSNSSLGGNFTVLTGDDGFGSGSAAAGGSINLTTGTSNNAQASINLLSGLGFHLTEIPGITIKTSTETLGGNGGGSSAVSAQILLQTGNGAPNSSTLTNSTGGKSGNILLTGGNGGIESGNSTTASLAGGAGSILAFTAGNGGNTTGTGTGGTYTGGIGGGFTLAGGAGGTASGAAGTQNGGAGGVFTLTGGTGGSGIQTAGQGGSITLQGGLGGVATTATSSATAGLGGDINLIGGNAQSTSQSPRGGNVNITGGNTFNTSGASVGGQVNITGGVPNFGGVSGSINLATVAGTANSAISGSINLTTATPFGTANAGAINLTTGNGGSAGGNASPWNGGAFVFKTGSGASNTAASSTSGAGGAYGITLGAGGTASGATAATGGAGGNFTLTGASGGGATGTGTDIAGAGSSVTLISGAGGAASGGTSNTGGAAGSITLQLGAAGTGATANGAAGSINFSNSTQTMAAFASTGQLAWNTGLGAITQILGPTDQALTIKSGSPASGNAQSLFVTAGSATLANGAGGSVTVSSGAGIGGGPGTSNSGSTTITAASGSGSGSSAAGAVNITGAAINSGSSGGAVNITTPSGSSNGSQSIGAINITTGTGSPSSSGLPSIPGGNIVITTGGSSAPPSGYAGTTGTVGGSLSTILGAGSPGGNAGVQTTFTGGTGGAYGITLGAGGASAASVAATGGTGSPFTVSGGVGGVANGAGVNIGGNGSAVSFTTGTGGAASGGTSNTNGTGGAFNVTTGTGGTSGAINLITGNGQNSGNINLTTGNPTANVSGNITLTTGNGAYVGNIALIVGTPTNAIVPGTLSLQGGSFSTTAAAAGTAGGPITITGGRGQNSNIALGTSGAGGALTLTSGIGGADAVASGTGGAGGLLSLLGAAGGNATGTTSTGGAGASLSFTTGAGGTGTSLGGNSGSMNFAIGTPGTGTTAGSKGFFNFTGGNVGIGITTPSNLLSIQDSTSGIPIQFNVADSSSTGRGDFAISNDAGNAINVQMSGSAYNSAALYNQAFIGTSGNTVAGFTINTNGNLGSGGTTPIYFEAGGYNVTPQITVLATTNAIGINNKTPTAALDELATTITGSAATSALNIAQTWNTTGTPTAFKMNITNTASNAASLLEDLQVGGSSKFNVSESGALTATGAITFSGITSGTACNSATQAVGYTSAGLLVCNTSVSDQRLKADITPLDTTTGLAAIEKLNPVSYYWKDTNLPGTGSTAEQFGFIAQDVQGVLPNLVTQNPATYLTPDVTYGLNYQGFTAVAVEAIKELDMKVEPLTSIDPTVSGSLADLIDQYLGDAKNKITKLFAGEVDTQKLCVGQTCLTEAQVQQILQVIQNQNQNGSSGSSSQAPSNGNGTTTTAAPSDTVATSSDDTDSTASAPAADTTASAPADTTDPASVTSGSDSSAASDSSSSDVSAPASTDSSSTTPPSTPAPSDPSAPTQ